MENTSGVSPLQSLALTECFNGKTDQQILDIIAAHLTFSQEAGESIQGSIGPQGLTGSAGTDGEPGAPGVTPVKTSRLYIHNPDLFSGGITEYEVIADIDGGNDFKLVFLGAGAAPANHYITYYQETGTGRTTVFFNAALTGNEWGLQVTNWA